MTDLHDKEKGKKCKCVPKDRHTHTDDKGIKHCSWCHGLVVQPPKKECTCFCHCDTPDLDGACSHGHIWRCNCCTPPTQEKTMEEQIENMKFTCPDCGFPHNLSTKAVRRIMSILASSQDSFRRKVEEEVTKAEKRMIKMNKKKAKEVYDIINTMFYGSENGYLFMPRNQLLGKIEKIQEVINKIT